LFFIAYLSISGLISYANPQIEELQKQLSDVEGEERFEVLLNLSKQHWFIDPTISIKYARDALALSDSLNSEIKRTRALNRIGNGFYFLEEYRIALDYYNQSLELSEEIEYPTGIAHASNNIGLIYNVLGDYDMAIDYYYRSLEIEKNIKDVKGIANTSINIGNIYYYLGNFDKARELFLEALKLFTELDDQRGLFDAYNNLGSTFSEEKMLDSAQHYYQKSLKLSFQLNDPDLKTSALNNLGTVYFNSGEYDLAIEYYNESLLLSRKIEDQWSEANTMRNLGGVYLEKKKYNSAIEKFNGAMKIARDIDATRLVMELYGDLSEYYKKTNNYKKAFEYKEKYSQLNDSIFNEETTKQISNLEAKYIFRTKDQQLALITKENEVKNLKIRTQQYIIYVFASLSLLILALVFVFYYRSHINKKARVMLEEKNIRITEQKILLEKTIDELKESEAKYKSLVDSIQDGLFILQQEKLIYANEAFCHILGYENYSEIYELNPEQIVAPEDYPKIYQNYQKRISGKYVPTSYEFKMIHKSGKPIDINLCAGMTRFHGKPALIGTIKDITSQKEYEQQLIREKERAEQATDSKSMFLAGMSHEIRNHMNSIIGITDVMAESELNPEQKEYVEVIKTSGNNLLTIINEILDFSKIEARQVILESEEFDLKKLIHEVITLHELKAKKAGLKLTSHIDPKVPEKIVSDHTRLSQVLINLVSNAIKFTPKGGVEVRVIPNSEKTEQSGLEIKFEVIDTGIGISKESQEKLFKAFSQTHSSVVLERGGSGLGLAISKQLVELMGGEIGVKSEINKGSTFWFTIMSSAKNKNETVKISKPLVKNTAASNNIHVLVVEDNLLNQQLTTNILLKEGFQVEVADNGEIGLEKYKSNNFDVVLMDIQMPVMDGIRATRLIRQFETETAHKKAMIIAITAYAKEGEKQRLFDAGMDFYLNKPYKPAELLKIISSLS
jgi:PAS domain S-box-containing protein